MDTKYSKQQSQSTQFQSPSGASHPVKVRKAGSSTESLAHVPDYGSGLSTRGKNYIRFLYNVDTVARRKRNLDFNRGPKRVSTTTSE